METKIRTATLLALLTAFISGTNNFLAKISVTVVSNPIVYTFLKNSIVAVLLVGLVVTASRLKELRSLTKRQFTLLLAIGFVGGFLPFALFFTGLTYTSAINAGLIHKTLIFWVALLAIPLLKERVSFRQAIGIFALFGANILIGGFAGFDFSFGEVLILLATLLWAVEHVVAKVALKELSSTTVAAARMVIGSLFLLLLVTMQGNLPLLSSLSYTAWGWTLLTSVLLFGYVTTWYAALKRAPATYVATLLIPATLITNLLTAIFLTHTFSLTLAAAVMLAYLGTELFIKLPKNKSLPQTAINNV